MPSLIGTVPRPTKRSGWRATYAGDAIVHDLRRLHRWIERHGIIALRRWRHHRLNIDAHVIEIAQTLGKTTVLSGDAGCPVDFLLRIHLLSVRRRKERERARSTYREMVATTDAAAGTATWE